MAWPFNKKTEPNAGEGDDKELNTFIEKIGASFQTKLEAAIAPVKAQVDGIQKRWDDLEKAAASGGGGEGGGNGGGEGGGELTDEQKRDAKDRAMLAGMIGMNARMTEGEVLGEVIAGGLSEFVPKIKEYFANAPLNVKGGKDYPIYCRNIVKMVVGEAALAGGLKFDGTGKKFFLEDQNGKGGGEEGKFEFLANDMTWKDPKSGRVLSGREQLDKLGIKPEEFQASIDKGYV